MKIEIASSEYWKILNYHDGILYCSILCIGGKDNWRMASDYTELSGFDNDFDIGAWYEDDKKRLSSCVLGEYEYWVIPVRDII